MPEGMMDARPDVLKNPIVAQSIADTVMGTAATPEEVAIVRDAAADSFETYQLEGMLREEAARRVNAEMNKLMREHFTLEELSDLEERAKRAAGAPVIADMEKERTRMEQQRALFEQIMQVQLEGGPEVSSQGRTVANPEFRAASSMQQAA